MCTLCLLNVHSLSNTFCSSINNSMKGIDSMTPLKYFLENKKKMISIILVISLTIFCIYFVSDLVQCIFKTAEESNVASLSKFSLVVPANNSLEIEENLFNEIKDDPSVKDVISVYLETTDVSNIIGKTTGYVVFCSQNDINRIFYECNLELISGRMPNDGAYEIIMHKDMLKNKSLSIGDSFGSSVNKNEPVSGRYDIVGIFDGDINVAFGTENSRRIELKNIGVNVDDMKFAILALPQNDIKSMNVILDSKDSTIISALTSSYITKEFEKQISGINSIMTLIIIIIVISMSTALSVAINNIYSSRMDEFGILFAIGYSKRRLLVKIIAEIFTVVLLSYIAGMALSVIMLVITNNLVFNQMGQSLSLISVEGFLFTLVSIIVMLISTSFPIINKLSKSDLISIIERR